MEDEGQETDDIRHPAGAAVIFGKYEMGRLLGQGTFAKVYEARNIETSQKVAIKVIPKDGGHGRDFVRHIIREISVMQLVRHPNVVVLNEVMATKQKIFVVMEHVLGGELFTKVAAGRLTEELARRYFQQLIGAVDFCHSRGVSHRDLKPENLLLDGDGNLKVSDFGLSSLPENLRLDGLLHTQCGTPVYVAPEVLRKRGYDGAKADVWSCGVILYVLLAGFLPFNDSNLMRMYTKIYKADFKFPPWISLESRRFISTLLVADPEKRIRIAEIIRTPWFRSPIEGSNHRIEDRNKEPDPVRSKKSTSPPFYNAFEFITSMSSGLDLSSLFQNRRKSGSLFTSKFAAPAIMAKLESVAKTLNFRVLGSKDYQVRMQGMTAGKKGKLAVTADISEVSPEVSVVEFSMIAGDTLEYRKFCEDDVRPGLKDIVWSWQWEDNPTQG